MISRLPSHPLIHLIVLLNRLALGWYFMLAGGWKVGEELSTGLGTFYRGDSYQGRVPGWLPEVMAMAHGYALPWVEMIFGALLILGLFGRLVAGVLALLALSIGVALLGAGDLLPRHHVMVFFALLLLLMLIGPGRYSVDGMMAQLRRRDIAPTSPASA